VELCFTKFRYPARRGGKVPSEEFQGLLRVVHFSVAFYVMHDCLFLSKQCFTLRFYRATACLGSRSTSKTAGAKALRQHLMLNDYLLWGVYGRGK